MATTRLSGKVAVVTGASQGLGEHLAIGLAREGAAVVLAARNAERLARVAAAITAAGGVAKAVATDVSDERQCEELIDSAIAGFGGIDILVLNAGFATYGKLEELETFAPVSAAMDVNFFGAAYPTYLAAATLIERKGVIAYVTSGSGHLPMAGYLGYTTSKHAMNGFFEALRLEMSDRGVAVVGVNPGDMYNDDGAGRAVYGPDGSQRSVDLSVDRARDVRRVSSSSVAEKVLDAIVDRRREIDLSPKVQKLATRLRPLLPSLIDRRIHQRAASMRSAFDPEVEEQRVAEQ